MRIDIDMQPTMQPLSGAFALAVSGDAGVSVHAGCMVHVTADGESYAIDGLDIARAVARSLRSRCASCGATGCDLSPSAYGDGEMVCEECESDRADRWGMIAR